MADPLHAAGRGRACFDSGGMVAEEGGGCGSAQTAHNRAVGSNAGIEALVEGAFTPALKLREPLAGSRLVRDLDIINDSPELPRIVAENAAISERLGQAVGMASGFAVDLLVGSDRASHGVIYSTDLHEWFVGLARDVQREVGSEEVRAAIDGLVARMEGYTRRPVAACSACSRSSAL